MTKPDFLIIGAARSSTSALARYLTEQPNVEITDPKEPHFLAHANDPPNYQGPGDDFLINDRVITDPADYEALFANALEGTLIGEGSVTTLAFPEASIPNIERYCSRDVKLIVCLRDPVERMFSSYLYLRSRDRETVTTFEEALALEPERTEENWHHMWRYRALSRYDLLIPPFIEHFGSERVHICISERLNGLESDEFRSIAQFLQLENVNTDTQFGKINAGGVPSGNVLSKAAMAVVGNEKLLEASKRVVPRTIQERLYSRIFDRPTLSPSLASELRKEFTESIELVEGLVGPIPEWRGGG